VIPIMTDGGVFGFLPATVGRDPLECGMPFDRHTRCRHGHAAPEVNPWGAPATGVIPIRPRLPGTLSLKARMAEIEGSSKEDSPCHVARLVMRKD
jgi:hypothetical protein